MSQTIHDEASYISESFGIPFVIALEVTLANASKAAKTNKTKKGSKRVDRK
jgi:hypothetical protein